MALFNSLANLFGFNRQAKAVNPPTAADAVPSYDDYARQEKDKSKNYQFLTMGDWVSVSSSNIDMIQYDHETQELFVQFRANRHGENWVYRYYPVEYSEARNFVEASSKGKWFWDNIRVRGPQTDGNGHWNPPHRVAEWGQYRFH